MTKRPVLDKHLDSKTFREFYYLKEELIDFCRKCRLPASGGKIEITDNIAYFLDTGKVLSTSTAKKRAAVMSNICEDTKIESGFVCSEKHRAFFKEHIGKSFSFNVTFQKWLKSNEGRTPRGGTYKETITAYFDIMEEKKKRRDCSNIEENQAERITTIPISVFFSESRIYQDPFKKWIP